MGILQKIADARTPDRGRKGFSQPPFWAADGLRLPFLSSYPLRADRETIENDFEGYVRQAFKANGIVFACILARQMVFAEARFQWRTFTDGRPGNLFGTQELSILEEPWPGGTTGELLSRMEQDASLAGNFWATTADDDGNLGRAATGTGRRIAHMIPSQVTMVIGSKADGSGSPNALDARVIGILHKAPATGDHDAVETLLLPGEYAHYSPIPDPEARFRGMSWLTPIIREIQADKAATVHKGRFFENAAVPNMVVKFDKDTSDDAFEEFVEGFNAQHKGAWNAYRTLFLMGGADVTPLTLDFKQLDFGNVVGKGESRIASAAGVPPSWVGFSEGLQGSALNAGNFNSARRRFADGTIKPLWRIAAASLQPILKAPGSAKLAPDFRDVAFLREDQTDVAEIQSKQAVALRALTDAGFDPDAAVRYLTTDDLEQLIGKHSGLYSVQLQEPGTSDSAGVGTVLSAEEARTILNSAGAGLSASFSPAPDRSIA